MSTKITLMYDAPESPDDFEARYDDQLALIGRIPHLQRVETHRIWPTGQCRPVLAYRLVELFFEDAESLRNAMSKQEAGSLFPAILGLGAGGVHIVYHEEGS